MDQIYDYLVAFSVVTALPDQVPEKHQQTNTMLLEDSNERGRIIHICWGTYDVKKKILTDEYEYFIKPYKFTELSPETITKSRISNELMNSVGMTLSDAIHKFNEAMYLNYICKNASFCLVTYRDDGLMQILPRDAKEVGVKLANHFFSYFDIGEEFKKTYKVTNNFSSLNDYLSFLKYKETQEKTLGQVENKSILRLIHRLIDDGHVFQNPKALNPLHQLITEKVDPLVPNRSHQNKKWNTFIRGRSPEPFRNPSKKWYIRLRGLPYGSREFEVMEFLRGIRVYKEDVSFLYDFEGKFSGEAYVQLHNESDFKEALSYNLSDLGNRYIEVFETNENETMKAKLSQYPEKREMKTVANPNWAHLLREGTGIVKMRGLPYSCTEEDIREFFRGYNIIEDGVKRAVIAGRPSGECFVIFETKEDAHGALSLNMEKIGNRFIELFSANIRELEIFLYHNFSNNSPIYSKENMPSIPLDKRKSTLMMVGLPFHVTKSDIMKFFGNFKLKETDIHLIPSHSGRFSGNALITLEDELESQRALKTKNLSYINNRYVELYEYR